MYIIHGGVWWLLEQQQQRTTNNEQPCSDGKRQAEEFTYINLLTELNTTLLPSPATTRHISIIPLVVTPDTKP